MDMSIVWGLSSRAPSLFRGRKPARLFERLPKWATFELRECLVSDFNFCQPCATTFSFIFFSFCCYFLFWINLTFLEREVRLPCRSLEFFLTFRNRQLVSLSCHVQNFRLSSVQAGRILVQKSSLSAGARLGWGLLTSDQAFFWKCCPTNWSDGQQLRVKGNLEEYIWPPVGCPLMTPPHPGGFFCSRTLMMTVHPKIALKFIS